MEPFALLGEYNFQFHSGLCLLDDVTQMDHLLILPKPARTFPSLNYSTHLARFVLCYQLKYHRHSNEKEFDKAPDGCLLALFICQLPADQKYWIASLPFPALGQYGHCIHFDSYEGWIHSCLHGILLP